MLPSLPTWPIEMWLSAFSVRSRQSQSVILIERGDYSAEITDDYDDLVERTPDGERGWCCPRPRKHISFVDGLDDEFIRSLQNLDPHGTELHGSAEGRKEPLLHHLSRRGSL